MKAFINGILGRIVSAKRIPNPERDAAYYKQLHLENPAYQSNNWLVEELPLIRRLGGKHLMEIGCGNGKFIRAAAPYYCDIIGVDWVMAPGIDTLLNEHPKIQFVKADLTKDQLPAKVDIIVSADVLEHLPPNAVPMVLSKLDACASIAYHKIACYDDGHSHTSIFSPKEWLAHFRRINPAYHIDKIDYRQGDNKKQVVCITKRT